MTSLALRRFPSRFVPLLHAPYKENAVRLVACSGSQRYASSGAEMGTPPKQRTEDGVLPGDADAITRIITARNACKSFDKTRPVSEATLRRILALTSVSPVRHAVIPCLRAWPAL
jgi:hypothetical protein